MNRYFAVLCAFAILLTAVPAAGQTASPAEVTINYARGNPQPPSVQVTFGPNVTSITNVTITGTNANLFTNSISQPNSIFVNINTGTVGAILNPLAQYTATMNVTTNSGTVVAVPLTLNIGTSGGAGTFTPSGQLTINVPVGFTSNSGSVTVSASPAQTVTVQSVTTDNLSAWMTQASVSPQTATTPAAFTVMVNSLGLPAGQYRGTITFTVGTQQLPYTVVMIVGSSGGGLTLSQTSAQWTYPSGTQSTTVMVFPTSATSVLASSNVSWITLDASTKTVAPGGSVAFLLSLTTNPSLLPPGNSGVGTVTFTGSDNSQNFMQVTLNSGTGALTPSQSQFTFSYPGTTSSFFTVSTNSGVDSTVTAFSNQSWLSVTPSSQTLPALGSTGAFTVTASPTFLTTGTHFGTITLQGASTTATINVTFNVGTGGGSGVTGLATPNTLTFTHQVGSSTGPGPQEIYLSGLAGGTYTVAFTPNSGSPDGLIFLNRSSGTLPDRIQVNVNLGLLSSSTTYSGNININSTSGFVSVPVTVNATTSPVVRANPSGLVFQAPTSVAQNRFIEIASSSESTPFPFTVSTSATWIRVSPTSGTTPNSSVQVTADPAGLAAGIYSGNVVINATGAGNTPLNVPVVLVVGTPTGSAVANPTSLSFTGVPGATTGSPTSQSVTVSSSTSGTYTAQANNSWIVVSPTSGFTPGVFNVSINPSLAVAGTNTGTITVTAGSLTQTITVTATIGGGVSTVTVDMPNITFDHTQGEIAPGARTLNITSNPSGASVTAAVTSGSSWLTATLAGSTTPTTLSVSVNPAALAPGAHTGTITITPSSGTPATINVTLNVRAAAGLTTTPSDLSFTYRTGSAAPAAGQVQVASTGSQLTFTATTSASWLRVTPAQASTPTTAQISVDPSSLNVGTHNGTVTFTASTTPASTRTVNVTLTITAPLPTIDRAANAASYIGNFFAPGEIVYLEGTGLGGEQLVEATVTNNRFPTELAGTRVLFNGVPGPMIYARTNAVAAVVPFSLAGASQIGIQVEYRGGRSNVVTRPLVQTAPGIFTLDASGTGPAAALNQDGSINGPNSPAAPGSVVVIFATGGGRTVPASTDGAPATGADRTVLPFEAEVGGRPATVIYSGAAPGLINGALQVNLRLDAGLPAGTHEVVIRSNNVSSQTGVTVVVR
jgi:uncharacterized protein (TIGR03437 family)